MSKILKRWMLFRYIGRELVPMSKAFKTKAEAEKARSKYLEGEQKKIGIGFVRMRS